MGLRKFFHPPKEMNRDEARDFLEDNGVQIKHSSANQQRKFKFGQFSQYAQDKARHKGPLRPRGMEDRSGAGDSRPEYSGIQGGAGSAGSAAAGSAAADYTSYRQRSSYNTDASASEGSAGNGNSSRYGAEDQYHHHTHAHHHHDDTHDSRRFVQSPPTLDPNSSSSSGPATQSSYGGSKGFDPYGPAASGSNSTEAENTNTGLQMQLQDDKQANTQSDAQTVESDFNQYPNGKYEPYLESQPEQQEQEVDSEEEEVNRIVRQTKDVRGATVESSHNILTNLRQADESATNTMGALGSQREKMYAMERNVNMMDTQQRFLDDHVKDLEHYNRGLFHIKASNPFTRSSRKKAAERKFMLQRQTDRERDDQLNGKLHKSQRAIIGKMGDEDKEQGERETKYQEKEDYDKRVKAASKYLTGEHDSEDEEMEVQYSRNVDEAQKLASNLHEKANVIAQEITSQNKNLEELSEKVNKVDDKMVLTTSRIRGI